MSDKVRVGINGFGRIGRTILRASLSRDDLEVVAINDLLPVDHLAYLLRHDTVHGPFGRELHVRADELLVGGRRITVSSETQPGSIAWGAEDVDVVIDATGRFLTQRDLEGHLRGGARKVVISSPPDDDTPVFVVGANEQDYVGQAIVSNASCTTNCVATLARVLEDEFGLEEALMLTVHAATATQNTVDGVARKDWRFGRSILGNIIPATTGAARMVGRVIPSLEGRINGMAVRVPVADVSMLDLTCRFASRPSYADICAAIRAAADRTDAQVLAYSEEPVVSTDLIGNSASAVLDIAAGMQTNGGLTKLVAWYDNEWGYACRCLDLSLVIHTEQTTSVAGHVRS